MFGKESVKLGDLQLDPQRRLVLRGTEAIRLPKLSYELLLCLVRHSPAVVTTDQLLDEVWGSVVVGDETLKQRVSLLRQALHDRGDRPRYIESIRGVGYRLIPAVESIPNGVPPARSRTGILAAATVGIALAAFLFLVPAFQPPQPRTIAVLPFEDLSPGGDHAYFSDGIHEELVARLSRNPSLAVTSRTSVTPYRNASMPLVDIANELGVELIIEGSVRQASGNVRITVQLINAVDDHHLWAENYDRPLTVGNLFEIQVDVADKVAEALSAEIGSDATVMKNGLPTNSLEAYESYLLGRYHLLRGNPEDLQKSLAYFEDAVAVDPVFAGAHVGLASSLAFIGTEYGWLPPEEAFSRAERHAEIALGIDPDLPAANSVRGDILTWYHWRWEDAERAYRKVNEPGTDADLGYLLLLSVLQRHDEVIPRMEALVNRFPRDHWIRTNAAWRYLDAGNPERAIAEATAAIAIEDGYGDPYASRGWALLKTGEIDKAIEDFERNAALYNQAPTALCSLAVARVMAGDETGGRALLEDILQAAQNDYVPPDEIARVYVALGDFDSAFLWLERALEIRSRGLIFLNSHLSWDPVRGDPRFRELLRALQLDEATIRNN